MDILEMQLRKVMNETSWFAKYVYQCRPTNKYETQFCAIENFYNTIMAKPSSIFTTVLYHNPYKSR